MDYLVVDGYNVINAWSDIFNLKDHTLEDCRERLLNILSNYQGYKRTNIIIVFDAHLVKGSQEKQERFDNITVVFTRENETADNYIERFVYRRAGSNRIWVATSDYLEQTMVLSNGGIRMSPRELKEEVLSANKTNVKNKIIEAHKKSNPIMANISPELVEKLEKIRRGGS